MEVWEALKNPLAEVEELMFPQFVILWLTEALLCRFKMAAVLQQCQFPSVPRASLFQASFCTGIFPSQVVLTLNAEWWLKQQFTTARGKSKYYALKLFSDGGSN